MQFQIVLFCIYDMIIMFFLNQMAACNALRGSYCHVTHYTLLSKLNFTSGDSFC